VNRGNLEYNPELDTVRTAAIASVLCLHFLPRGHWINRLQMQTGWGVFLFFVLSGFLITRILLRCRTAMEAGTMTVGLSLRNFYARRFLRIFPLYYFVLFAGTALGYAGMRAGLPWHLAYLSNVYSRGLRALDTGPAAPFWSLSVEEQFYVFWPFLILLLPLRTLPRTILGIAVAGFVIRFWARRPGSWDNFLTPACMGYLALGAYLAISEAAVCGGSDRWRALVMRGYLIAAGAMIAGLVFVHFLLSPGATKTILHAGLLDTAAGLIFAWIIGRLAAGTSGWVHRLICLPPLLYLGRISYGLYVYQFFVAIPLAATTAWWQPRVGAPAAWWLSQSFSVRVLLLIAVASVSWFVMEKPLNDLKRYFPYSRRSREASGSSEYVRPGVEGSEIASRS
jgi:peptidoglycan/LPS O-acetylase OafA/YrhL